MLNGRRYGLDLPSLFLGFSNIFIHDSQKYVSLCDLVIVYITYMGILTYTHTCTCMCVPETESNLSTQILNVKILHNSTECCIIWKVEDQGLEI